MRFLAVLKFVLVLGLLAVGTLFLLKGFGVEIPVLKYKTLEAHDIPAGIAIMVVGVALACGWKIRSTYTVVEERTEKRSDGTSATTRLEIKADLRSVHPISDKSSTTTRSETRSDFRFMPGTPDEKRHKGDT
jgi:hypothetical protein